MTIRAIKPLPVRPVPTPQCCAVPDETDFQRLQAWRQDRYKRLRPNFDPLKCQRVSSVEINGQHYCAPHAGRLALRKWLKGELVERQTPEPPGGRVAALDSR